MKWPEGQSTVDFLVKRGRLEFVNDSESDHASIVLMGRASDRLASASTIADSKDVNGAYSLAYDAYRMAAEALLLRQGLRATGGDGSHMTVEDTVAAQFADRIPQFAKRTFEMLRTTRHRAQYFELKAPEIKEDDATWAISTAAEAIAAAQALIDGNLLDHYS